jgi:hypothetical protein
MLGELKLVRRAVAEKRDPSPGHERDDDSKAQQEDETNPVGSRVDTLCAHVDGINALGCKEVRGLARGAKRNNVPRNM